MPTSPNPSHAMLHAAASRAASLLAPQLRTADVPAPPHRAFLSLRAAARPARHQVHATMLHSPALSCPACAAVPCLHRPAFTQLQRHLPTPALLCPSIAVSLLCFSATNHSRHATANPNPWISGGSLIRFSSRRFAGSSGSKPSFPISYLIACFHWVSYL